MHMHTLMGTHTQMDSNVENYKEQLIHSNLVTDEAIHNVTSW